MLSFELTDGLRADMVAHAEREQPRECCGVVLRSALGNVIYAPVPNSASHHAQFLMDTHYLAAVEDASGEVASDTVLAIVHSHPNASANPSMADRAQCEKSGLPWLIVGWPSGVVVELQPSGWLAPYRGREFHHGVMDCYTLGQDWYLRELGIELPDVDREDGWWEERPGHAAQDLYMEHFAQAGFVRVYGEPQRHDGILMQVKSNRANHAAVYLGDGVMLHHLHGRPSEETLYGGYWQRHTLALVRHISQISPAQALDVALAAA